MFRKIPDQYVTEGFHKLLRSFWVIADFQESAAAISSKETVVLYNASFVVRVEATNRIKTNV